MRWEEREKGRGGGKVLCQPWSVFFLVFGGDSSNLRDALRGIVAVYSAGRAFAAVKKDGSVVTWGDSGLFVVCFFLWFLLFVFVCSCVFCVFLCCLFVVIFLGGGRGPFHSFL